MLCYTAQRSIHDMQEYEIILKPDLITNWDCKNTHKITILLSIELPR